MDAIEFVIRYPEFVKEIRDVIRPELFPLLDELDSIDPHDLVRPEAFFLSVQDGRGFVWSLFLIRAEKDRLSGTKNLG
jgi:hypothetical protein